MGGRGPAQVVAPSQAKPIWVEISEARDQIARDRHCPKCQGLSRLQWLADRRAELLPVAYFHVVFTVPAPVAAIALQNKALVYDILFKAAAESGATALTSPSATSLPPPRSIWQRRTRGSGLSISWSGKRNFAG